MENVEIEGENVIDKLSSSVQGERVVRAGSSSGSRVTLTKGGHCRRERQKFRQRLNVRQKADQDTVAKRGGAAVREMIALEREGRATWGQVQETIERWFPGSSTLKKKSAGESQRQR
jgi:hypothetical protein